MPLPIAEQESAEEQPAQQTEPETLNDFLVLFMLPQKVNISVAEMFTMWEGGSESDD